MRKRVSLALRAGLFLTLTASTVYAGGGLCGQPVSTGATPTASDCLFILKSAVGSTICDPECVCDTNGTGGVTASDALRCLSKAVGLDVALDCPCGATTTTLPSSSCGLLVNGRLDDPVTTSPENGWSFANIDGAGGWRSSGGNPGGYFTLNQAGDLNTDPTLSQTVEGLTIGATYTISGEYRSFAAGYGNPQKPDAFAVQVEPQPSDHDSIVVLGLPRPSPDAFAWTGFTVDFVASDTSSTISFVGERDGDDSSFDVDNLCLGPK